MTQMSNRRVVPVVVILLIGVVCAEDRVQSELRFAAHSKDEKTAGVWVDGQYVGFVKELAGDKKLTLLPGKHEIVIRQPGTTSLSSRSSWSLGRPSKSTSR